MDETRARLFQYAENLDGSGLARQFREVLGVEVYDIFFDSRLSFTAVIYTETKSVIMSGDPGVNKIVVHRMIDAAEFLGAILDLYFSFPLKINFGDDGSSGEICFCSNMDDSILVPDTDFLASKGYADHRGYLTAQTAWSERSSIPYWRGSSTGLRAEGSDILSLPRVRLCAICNELSFDAKITSIVQMQPNDNVEYLGRFRGTPRPWFEAATKRYNLDIDGNSSAWSSLFIKLLCGGVVLKVTSEHGFRQWYYDRLVPWVNYVPVRSDLSDLREIVIMLEHEQTLAQEIAARGRELAVSMTYRTEIESALRRVRAFYEKTHRSEPGTMMISAHNTFLAHDPSRGLIQVGDANDARVLRVEPVLSGQPIQSGPLANHTIVGAERGVAFEKAGRYITAEHGSDEISANRTVIGAWETFVFVPEEQISRFGNRADGREASLFRKRVEELQAERLPVKLYCGCGLVPRPGFINLDIEMMVPSFMALNPKDYFIFPFANTPWQIPDSSVDFIFHEDFIEHLPQAMQWQFLAECLRVMKPGSYHRVNTPSLVASMKRHSNFKQGMAGVYTGEEQWGHIAVLTPGLLKEMAETIGYSDVIFTTRHHSVSPYAVPDIRPGLDRDEITGNIFADLRKGNAPVDGGL